MAKSSFKLEHPLERRLAESARIREKYQDRIPVIVERAEKSDVPDIDKKKYLVPADLTVGQFVYVVRKRIKLSPEKAIFIFVKNNTLPPTAALMSAIFDENKDDDGFLYMVYSGENTFGNLLKSKKIKMRNMRSVRGVKNGLKRGLWPSITWSMGKSFPLHAIAVSPSNTCLQCQANS